MNIIIVGCGKVGTRIAGVLSKMGHEIAVVDRDENKFSNLPEDFTGITICGVPMDLDVLESAGISSCDALAAVSSDDNLNIVISQLAKMKYNVPRVVTRVLDPTREDVFESFGLKTICPTKLAANALLNVLLDELCQQHVTFATHCAGFYLRKDKRWIGKMICDIPVFDGEIIYGIISDNGNMSLATDPERVFGDDEKIIFSSLID